MVRHRSKSLPPCKISWVKTSPTGDDHSGAIMSVVLVTGANGFVGGHLCTFLESRGYTVRRAVRTLNRAGPEHAGDSVAVGDIGSTTNWQDALSGVDALVHLAARVHVLDDRSTDPLAAFREVNTYGTRQLARQAVDAGVRRFVYVSSIKAATGSTGQEPQRESDPAQPDDAYGQSKLEAERELFQISAASPLEPVVIRPPLVYGPGVGANFLRMLKVVEKGVPLPFQGLKNHRSLVSVTNLCSLVECCLENDAAVGEVFHVSDGVDLSTPELLQTLGRAVGRRARLFSLPEAVLRFMFWGMGRSEEYERLCGSLHLSIDKARDELDWTPQVEMDDALRQTIAWYNDDHQKT